MAGVIDLAAWREERLDPRPGEARLERAVERLDHVLAEQGWDRPPTWVVTELLAIQGCVSMGLTLEAVRRAERLTERVERLARRARAR